MAHGTIRLGIVGAAGRGGDYRRCIAAIPGLELAAVCELGEERAAACGRELEVEHAFGDYLQMLDSGLVDAVLIGTPMQLHAEMAIAALERGIHAGSEVTAATDLEQCRALVEASAASAAVYAMVENYTWFRAHAVVAELVRAGRFGHPYFGEGRYIHDCRWIEPRTPWRRRWQTGINGITYGTHCLGPILSWFAGQRLTAVSCSGSGPVHRDAEGRLYENEAPCVMLGRLSEGGLASVVVDTLSPRPEGTSYQLQASAGAYRWHDDCAELWLADHHPADPRAWHPVADFEADFLPADWRRFESVAPEHAHRGGDLLALAAFVEAVRGAPNPIGIHQAMDLTIPGLISQASVSAGGAWLPVPDSRSWVTTGVEA